MKSVEIIEQSKNCLGAVEGIRTLDLLVGNLRVPFYHCGLIIKPQCFKGQLFPYCLYILTVLWICGQLVGNCGQRWSMLPSENYIEMEKKYE